MKKADTWFSKFIRERDKDKPCITCGKHTDKKDCGHFMSRRFQSTRYDEKNAHGQCEKCNRFQYGNQYEHALMIDKMYGQGTSHEINLKSKMLCKRNQSDFEYIALEYKKKYEELRDRTGN